MFLHWTLKKNVSTFPGFYVKHVFYLKCKNCANVVLWLFHRCIQCILITVHLCSLLCPLHYYYHYFSLQVSFLHSWVFFVMWLTEFNQVCLYDVDVELPLEAAEERSGGNPQSWRSSPPISLRLRDIKWYLLLNDHHQWKANNRLIEELWERVVFCLFVNSSSRSKQSLFLL